MSDTPETEQSAPPLSDRTRIIEAVMGLLAERSIDEIGFGQVAVRAGLSLAQCRQEFGSVLAVVAAHTKEIDRRVLAAGTDHDVAEEPPRERLFDVLMRRLELLAPYRAAVWSLMRSARSNPALALALNLMTVRSQQWMLTAADIDAVGPKGVLRAQGLSCLYASVLRTWVDDDEPGLARTMAALDRELGRAARWAGFIDDLCRLVPRPGRRRDRGRRRSQESDGGEPVAV